MISKSTNLIQNESIHDLGLNPEKGFLVFNGNIHHPIPWIDDTNHKEN
ncbi:MAG: hypothetical protein Q8890_02570 [Sweet potato little leaf phytoplasma]|nr:hypothetical protein [Sweet potato little leaf phytoplasma]